MQAGAFGRHFRFAFLCFAQEAGFACLVAGLGVGGGLAFAGVVAQGGFAVFVVVNQGDGGRADAGADAAFDAVEEAILFQAFAVVVAAVPVELLRQQFHGAGVGAVRAADAVFFARRGLFGEEEDAVAGFFQAGTELLLRVPHHRAADDAARGLGGAAGVGDEGVKRGAKACAHDLRPGERFAA